MSEEAWGPEDPHHSAAVEGPFSPPLDHLHTTYLRAKMAIKISMRKLCWGSSTFHVILYHL